MIFNAHFYSFLYHLPEANPLTSFFSLHSLSLFILLLLSFCITFPKPKLTLSLVSSHFILSHSSYFFALYFSSSFLLSFRLFLSFVLKFLFLSALLTLFFSSHQRALFAGAQKLFGILITVGEAIAYVVSGTCMCCAYSCPRRTSVSCVDICICVCIYTFLLLWMSVFMLVHIYT